MGRCWREVLCTIPALLMLVVFASSRSVSALANHMPRFQVGFGIDHVNIRVGSCSASLVQQNTSMAMMNWRQNVSFGIENAHAQFLVFRFAYINLPVGASLVIRDGFHHGRRHTEKGALRFDHSYKGQATNGVAFYTRPLHSRRAVIEFTVDSSVQQSPLEDEECYGFHIDQYRFAAQSVYRGGGTGGHGHGNREQGKHTSTQRQRSSSESHVDGGFDTESLLVDPLPSAAATRDKNDKHRSHHFDKVVDSATCVSAADDSDRAACVRFNGQVFEKSSAIARLLVHKEIGSIFCTGWLFGCEGHVMTNHHCVSDERDANATFIEFLAQGQKCREDCDTPMGCPGVIEATSSAFVAYSPSQALDFAMLLPRLSDLERLNLTRKYGFLTMRSHGAIENERIFIPQHPAGFGKRVALKHRASYGQVVSLNESGCNQRLESVGYLLNTKGGSSGSPVIAYADNAVIGLHYCGGCLNSAIPSDRIIQTLIDAAALPKCALAEFQWPLVSSTGNTTTNGTTGV